MIPVYVRNVRAEYIPDVRKNPFRMAEYVYVDLRVIGEEDKVRSFTRKCSEMEKEYQVLIGYFDAGPDVADTIKPLPETK